MIDQGQINIQWMVGGWVDDGGYWIYNYDECLLDDEWKFAGY